MGDLIRYFMEMGGRRRRLPPADFPEDEVILAAADIDVNPLLESAFVNLPPAVYGVITSPDGARLIITSGGMKDLAGGIYKLHYIDSRERTRLLSEIAGTTSDGFKITLKVLVTYRVTKPDKVLDVAEPVKTLITTLEAAIKNYIISHTHDEIIKTKENDDTFDDRAMENYVIRQLSQNQACSGFNLSNLTIQEWLGDSRALELRQKSLIIEKENENKKKQIHLEQNVVDEEKILVRKRGEVEQTKAESEANIQKILYTAQELKIELQKMSSLPERRHQEIMKVIEALKEMPGFPRNASEAKILQDLTNALIEKTETAEKAPAARSNGRSSGNKNQEQKVSDLANTILGLIKP